MLFTCITLLLTVRLVASQVAGQLLQFRVKAAMARQTSLEAQMLCVDAAELCFETDVASTSVAASEGATFLLALQSKMITAVSKGSFHATRLRQLEAQCRCRRIYLSPSVTGRTGYINSARLASTRCGSDLPKARRMQQLVFILPI